MVIWLEEHGFRSDKGSLVENVILVIRVLGASLVARSIAWCSSMSVCPGSIRRSLGLIESLASEERVGFLERCPENWRA
mgnify:CR=1 FL=1